MEVPERWDTAVREDVWWFRLYLWFYQADEQNTDFCRLFWGFLFMPILFLPVMLVRGVYELFQLIKRGTRKLGNWIQSKKKVKETPTLSYEEMIERDRKREEEEKAAEERKKRRQERWQKFFTRIEIFVTKVGFTMEKAWRYIKYPVFLIAGALAVAILVGAGYLVQLVADDVWHAIEEFFSWDDWPLVGLIILGGAIIAGAVVALYLFSESKAGQAVGTKIDTTATPFFSAMGTGVKAIKYKTCPQIKVIDKNGRVVGGDAPKQPDLPEFEDKKGDEAFG